MPANTFGALFGRLHGLWSNLFFQFLGPCARRFHCVCGKCWNSFFRILSEEWRLLLVHVVVSWPLRNPGKVPGAFALDQVIMTVANARPPLPLRCRFPRSAMVDGEDRSRITLVADHFPCDSYFINGSCVFLSFFSRFFFFFVSRFFLFFFSSSIFFFQFQFIYF